MNPLIYVIVTLLVICILYHLSENIKNLFQVREGFLGTDRSFSLTPFGKGIKSSEPLNLRGKYIKKKGRCANYKVKGNWVRDGQFSSCNSARSGLTTSLKDCANMFGEKGGVFSYNYKTGGCLYTKTDEPHIKYNINGIRSGCKAEGWGGGWNFFQAVDDQTSDSRTIQNFFPPHTFPKKLISGHRNGKGTVVKNYQQFFFTNEKTIPKKSIFPYILQYEYKINDQGWGNNTYGIMSIVNLTRNNSYYIVKKGLGRNEPKHCGKMDISKFVNAGDKISIRFHTSRYNSGHSLDWLYYKNMNLTYHVCEPPPPPEGPNAFYYNCERKTFIEHHLSAIAMGGHLASIHNEKDNRAIRKIIKRSSVWIGAVRKRPGKGDSSKKWTWTDGSNWNYSNWRRGDPKDFQYNKTAPPSGEIHAILMRDGRWNDMPYKFKNLLKLPAVYKLNATYANSWPHGFQKINTDGMNSWKTSKKMCGEILRKGDLIVRGTLASRRDVLDYLKGKPKRGDSWTPVSDGDNVWLQIGMRNDRKTGDDRVGKTPSFGMTHQEIPDIAYRKSVKPWWGTSNKSFKWRNTVYCKKPPPGMTWDDKLKKFVKLKIPNNTSQKQNMEVNLVKN